jgi:hypothetical protein
VSVRARRRTAQPERGRSDGQSSTWARVRTGGTMGVARTPRRYTSSTDDTVLRSGRRNTKISGFMFVLARSAGVYYTGVRLMKHGAITFPTRYLINYSNDNETRRRRRIPALCLKSALALARRYAIRGKLLAGSRLKRWACGHPPRRWRRWRKVLGTVRVLGTALNRVAAGASSG